MSPINAIVKVDRETQRRLTISPSSTMGSIDDLRALKIGEGDLTAGLVNTMAFGWQNPEPTDIIVREVIIDVVTAAVAAAVLDVETAISTAAKPGTNTIFDAAPLDAVRVYDSLNVTDDGATGTTKPRVLTPSTGILSWITGWEGAGGSMAGLVGKYYIIYQEV